MYRKIMIPVDLAHVARRDKALRTGTDLDKILLKAIEEQGADLVVMASHVPGLIEHLFAFNAGYVASHAKVSVLVVR